MTDLSSSLSPDFDPMHQNVTFFLKDGSEIVVQMSDINALGRDMTIAGTHAGAQMGACLIIAGMLLLTSSRASMYKPLFILNLTSLLLGFLRALFNSLYVSSPWSTVYTQFGGDFLYVLPIHYSYSYGVIVVHFLMALTINTSLALQAYSVCSHLHQRWHRMVLVGVSVLIITVAIGFRLASCILNFRVMKDLRLEVAWVFKTTPIINVVALLWFMGIFIWKLLYTVYVRRRMGWVRMSVFKTLTLASGFTMVVPFVFAVLQIANTSIYEISSWAVTSAALFLPLSTIWAKTALEEESGSIRLSQGSQHSNNGSSGIGSGRFASQSSSVATSARKESFAPLNNSLNKSTIDTIIEHASPPHSARDSTEMDLERMGVRVDRSYAVREAH